MTLDERRILNVPKIIREVGKAAGEIELQLAYPYDASPYGSATGINLFDLVKIYAVNAANPNGKLMYQGHIVEIEGVLEEDGDRTIIRIHPIDALLASTLYVTGGTYAKSYAGGDIDTMFADVVTSVNAVIGTSFFTNDSGNPGKSITVDFTRLTHTAQLEKAAAFLDADWYWRIDADGTIKLAEFSVTADRTFTLGLDVQRLRVGKSIKDVKNGTLVAWGATPTIAFYQDATSKSDYGPRQEVIEDSAIGNSGSADEAGNGNTNRKKDSKTKTELVINATYAIENIKPGETCQIRNVKSGTAQMLSGVLRILRVEYDGAVATLQLSELMDNLGDEFKRTLA